jgi:hypothetical protein
MSLSDWPHHKNRKGWGARWQLAFKLALRLGKLAGGETPTYSSSFGIRRLSLPRATLPVLMNP